MKLVLSFERGVQDSNSTYFPNLAHFDYKYLILSEFLSRGMGFSYQILGGKPGGKRLANGEWTGVIGMLHRGEADMAISPLIETEDRLKVVDFGFPFIIDSVTFVVRKIEKQSGLLTILSPFSYNVWFSFLISSLLVSFFLYLFPKKTDPFFTILGKVYRSILCQSVNFSPKDNGKRILFLPWFLGLAFLGLCYTSLLLSSLTFPKLNVVRDISELSRAVRRDEYLVMVRNTSPFGDILSTSENEDARTIGDGIYKNPEGFGTINMFLNSSDRNVAFIELRHKLNFLRNAFFIPDDYFFCSIASIAVRKTFCCKEKLHMVFHRIAASGLYQKILMNVDFQESFHLFTKEKFHSQFKKPLTIADLSGAFLIIVVGNAFGFIVLIIEILFQQRKRASKQSYNS